MEVLDRIRSGTRRSWRATRDATRSTGSGVASAYRRVATRGAVLPPVRMEAAMRATRPWVFVQTLAWFVFGLSVDDLGVLRVPGYVVAVAGALFAFSVGGVLQARRLVVRNLSEDNDAFEVRMTSWGRVGLLAVVAAVLASVGWFVVFSAGVPPWAA